MKEGKQKFNGHQIDISNSDKIFYPKDNITKGDVLEYYDKIFEYMLPHIEERPIVMQRFPDGISKDGFYHKEMPDYFPSWIQGKSIYLKKGGKQKLSLVDEKADIIYMVDQGTVTFHAWLSRQSSIQQPDKMIFDLDPPGKDFSEVKFAARKLRDVCDEKGFTSFVMTTGSKGLHVVVPIKPQHDFETVRKYAKKIVDELVDQYPDKLTTETRMDKRKGRVFLDYLRNSFGQMSVVPYSLKPLNGAPIATPLEWDEVSSIENSQKYTIHNIFRRLGRKEDPWKDFFKHKNSLKN